MPYVAGGKKRGVAILFNINVYYTNEETIQDNVMVVGSIAVFKISVLNIYAPNEVVPKARE